MTFTGHARAACLTFSACSGVRGFFNARTWHISVTSNTSGAINSHVPQVVHPGSIHTFFIFISFAHAFLRVY